MKNYLLLAMTLLLTVVFLYGLYFLLVAGPAATAIMEQDAYAACIMLMEVLGFGQSLLLVFCLAMVVIHLFYVLNRYFGREGGMVARLFVAEPFSLTREVLYDGFVVVVVLLMVGGIEMVRHLFDCGMLRG